MSDDQVHTGRLCSNKPNVQHGVDWQDRLSERLQGRPFSPEYISRFPIGEAALAETGTGRSKTPMGWMPHNPVGQVGLNRDPDESL